MDKHAPFPMKIGHKIQNMQTQPVTLRVIYIWFSGSKYKTLQHNSHDSDGILIWLQELGGNSWWFDRLLAQVIATSYYFMTVLMYALSPRMACKYAHLVFWLITSLHCNIPLIQSSLVLSD